MCDKPCTQLNDYVDFMAKTAQRDKVMAIVQFLPAVLEPIVKAQGHETLGVRLSRLATAADSYRTFTRFSWIADNVSSRSIASIKATEDCVVRSLRTAETGILTVRFAAEHLNYLTSWEVIPGQKGHWGRLGILLWFYALALANIRTVYDLVKKNKALTGNRGADKAAVREFKRAVLGLVVTVCFTIFNLSLQPAKGAATAQLCPNKAGGIVNKLLALATPRQLPLAPSTRAVLGLTASAVDLYLCVTGLPPKKKAE